MRIALIGLGMVARTHVRAIVALGDECRLAGVLSTSQDRAKAFLIENCSDLPTLPKVYRDVTEIAQDPDIDFVVICTPPNARRDLVETLAGAGKHILMEKPIERTLSSAQEIVGLCEKFNVELGIFFQHRMRASAVRLCETLASGILGEIAVVEIAVPWWREQTYYDEPGRGTFARDGGGVLISQAIHTLDLALTFTGPVTRVQAMARTSSLHTMEAEDFVTAGLDFASGAIGSLVASTASFPGQTESIVLHCKNGTAVLKSGLLELAFHDGRNERFGEESGTGGGADPMAFTHEWHQAIVEEFMLALKAGRSPSASTGRDGLKVHALIEALIRSSNEERAVAVEVLE